MSIQSSIPDDEFEPLQLKDFDAKTLGQLIGVLERRNPPAIVEGPESVDTETKRLSLAHRAGAHNVVRDLKAAMKQASKRETDTRHGVVR